MTIAKTNTTPADLVVSAFPTSEEIAHALRTGNRIHVDDSSGDNIGRSISALEATSIDEVFGSDLTKPSSILGTTLKLERFEGLRSRLRGFGARRLGDLPGFDSRRRDAHHRDRRSGSGREARQAP